MLASQRLRARGYIDKDVNSMVLDRCHERCDLTGLQVRAMVLGDTARAWNELLRKSSLEDSLDAKGFREVLTLLTVSLLHCSPHRHLHWHCSWKRAE